MKIRYTTGWTVSEGMVSAIETKELSLCGQGRPEGSAAGMIPVKLAPGPVIVTPLVTITTNTSTTKRGSRSAVVKVSMPYTALRVTADGNLEVDPNRSGGEVSVHTVIALPAAAVKDIQGVNGGAQKSAAEAQVAIVYYLLQTLLGGQLGSTPWLDITDAKLETRGSIPHIVVGEEPFAELTSHDAVPPVVSNIAGYTGEAGFDVTNFKLANGLNSALIRVANNLPILSCGDITQAGLPVAAAAV